MRFDVLTFITGTCRLCLLSTSILNFRCVVVVVVSSVKYDDKSKGSSRLTPGPIFIPLDPVVGGQAASGRDDFFDDMRSPTLRISGRMTARLPAVMAKPGSAILQIVTSVVFPSLGQIDLFAIRGVE